jgi:hypothetical protein
MSGRLARVALLLAFCSGCDNPIEEERACTQEARASVQVTVVDPQGNQLSDASVVFSLDGSPESNCENISEGLYVCGWEREGSFVVSARKVGYRDAHTSVDVGLMSSGCHVDGKQITLTLTPS